MNLEPIISMLKMELSREEINILEDAFSEPNDNDYEELMYRTLDRVIAENSHLSQDLFTIPFDADDISSIESDHSEEKYVASPERHLVPCKMDSPCTICLLDGIDSHALPCKHAFCRTCIVKWLSKSNTCPVCRSNVTE